MEKTSEIYLAGGCFWGTEHFLKQIRGVKHTEVGYANGNTASPTYKEVCTDKTGFAETVKVVYNPQEVSLELLLNLYFQTIDPTSINRQGHDQGTQYRTGIYYTDKADLTIIQNAVCELAKEYSRPLALEVEPLKNFYNAEEYHQNYLDKNPDGIVTLILNFLNWHDVPMPSLPIRSQAMPPCATNCHLNNTLSPKIMQPNPHFTMNIGTKHERGFMSILLPVSPYLCLPTNLIPAADGLALPNLSTIH